MTQPTPERLAVRAAAVAWVHARAAVDEARAALSAAQAAQQEAWFNWDDAEEAECAANMAAERARWLRMARGEK